MMGFSNFLYFLFSLPFLGGMAISLVFMTFSLFSIFKNWNTGRNKELFNGLLISGLFLLITNVFLFIISKIFYYGGFYGNFYLVIVALIVIGLIYFIGNSKERIYPDNYFSNISNVEFLKRELNDSINVLFQYLTRARVISKKNLKPKRLKSLKVIKIKMLITTIIATSLIITITTIIMQAPTMLTIIMEEILVQLPLGAM